MIKPAPLTRDGRQTLVYLCLAGSGPILTGVVIWAMTQVRVWDQVNPLARLGVFANLAYVIAASLMVIVIALACFVSIRAIKVGKDGIEATSSGSDGSATTTLTTDAGTASITLPTAPAPPVDAPAPDN